MSRLNHTSLYFPLLKKAINNTDSIKKLAPRGYSKALKAVNLKHILEQKERNIKTSKVKSMYKASIVRISINWTSEIKTQTELR